MNFLLVFIIPIICCQDLKPLVSIDIKLTTELFQYEQSAWWGLAFPRVFLCGGKNLKYAVHTPTPGCSLPAKNSLGIPSFLAAFILPSNCTFVILKALPSVSFIVALRFICTNFCLFQKLPQFNLACIDVLFRHQKRPSNVKIFPLLKYLHNYPVDMNDKTVFTV